jgi:hypothetical protein
MTIAWDIDSSLETVTIMDNSLVATDEIVDNEEFFDFEIVSVDDDVVLIKSISFAVNDQDKLLTATNDAEIIHNKQLSIVRLSGNLGVGKPVWTNADSNGYVTSRVVATYVYKAPATERVVVKAVLHGISRSISLVMPIYYIPSPADLAALTYEWVSDVVGYVRDNAAHCIDDLVAVGGDRAIYTTQDHVTATYVRNPNCWAASLDMTCMSPWNSTGVTQYACTLITPRHVIMAKHVPIAVGATVRFVAADNTVVTRTVTARWLQSTTITGLYDDLAIGLLDDDVPATISFAKCLPPDWETYFGSGYPIVNNLYRQSWLPIIFTDKDEQALIAESSSIIHTIGLNPPTISSRLPYYEIWIPGDSGSPAFFVINGELVILGCALFPTGCGVGFIMGYDLINAALTSLGGGYQLTNIDLSSFRSFI